MGKLRKEENRQTARYKDYCGLGPIRGQVANFVTLWNGYYWG